MPQALQFTSTGITVVDLALSKEAYILRTKFSSMKFPMLDLARELTSGTIPTKEIKPNRPFASNNPGHKTVRLSYGRKVQNIRVPIISGSNFPLLPINSQSDGLHSNFATKIYQLGDTTLLELYNRKKYGGFILSLDGTQNMVGRGFQQRMKSRLGRIRLNG